MFSEDFFNTSHLVLKSNHCHQAVGFVLVQCSILYELILTLKKIQVVEECT